VVCHPHPLYGGDMQNPVVTTVVEAAAARDLATLRFNFRGVGRSTGTHGGGAAEIADARAALAALRDQVGADVPLALAGYSFGAMVAMRLAAAGSTLAGLVLVAPPLAVAESGTLPPVDGIGSVLVIAGRHEDYCPEDRVTAVRLAWPEATVRQI